MKIKKEMLPGIVNVVSSGLHTLNPGNVSPGKVAGNRISLKCIIFYVSPLYTIFIVVY